MLTCVGIFVALALILDFYAGRTEVRQAKRISGLLQTEMVSNLDSRLYAVEQVVKRTGMELKNCDAQFIEVHGNGIMRSILEGDSIIEGCAVVLDSTHDAGRWIGYMRHIDDSTTYAASPDLTPWHNLIARVRSHGMDRWSKPYIDKIEGKGLKGTTVRDSILKPVCRVSNFAINFEL